MLNIILADAA